MFDTVNLEMSLKPFKQTSPEYIQTVCNDLFRQWRPMLKNRKVISVMLWVGDGSEILDYAGDLNDTFEWAYWLGTANLPLLDDSMGKDTSLHSRKQYYMNNPPSMTYSILRTIVHALHETGQRLYPDAKIRVGATFDIGPEFSISDFKYRRHPEISTGDNLDSFGFVDATALLNKDDRKYAAYPDGIPDKTPFATFLGRQSCIFLRDMGFDYLWLSNGLGFSADPWKTTGKVFDGQTFHIERLEETRSKVFAFWKLFREACPDYPLEVRGTNNSVGIDYATDGVPLYEIYNSDFDITPPPNSPWAAINDDFGLEMMGHMTRICNLPGDQFPFRYYIHDPWWVNSPWYDRYNGCAHDIYLPMAISRINESGQVCSAQTLNILSIDNSFGDLPDNCVNEPLPHLLKAEKDIADSPAPLVWVYPMREYTTAADEQTLREMYDGDNYIRHAINHGFPLNCVVSTDIFLKTPLSVYKASILISPIPESHEIAEKLIQFQLQGGKVIYYGSSARQTELPAYAAFIDTQGSPDLIREELENYGYSIRFDCKPTTKKPAAIAIARADNAHLFSVYNPNHTTDTLLRFPLGAPILTGTDTELRNGHAVYRFSTCEHHECRVFVSQDSGVVSLKEKAPASGAYHRKIGLSGLVNATVCVFPEKHPEQILAVSYMPADTDNTPVYDNRWVRIEDEKYGVYYRAENITGDYLILLPYKNQDNK